MESDVENELSALTLDPGRGKQDQPGVCAVEKIRAGRESGIMVNEEE